MIDTAVLRTLSQASTLLGYAILVRSMRKEDFGVFNLLYSFIPLVSTLASLGLEQTLRRYQPEYLRSGDAAAAVWLVRFVAAARLAANAVILGILLLAWDYLAPLFQLTPFRGAFLLFSVLIVLHFQMQILQMALASHMLQRFSVGAVVVLSVAKLIAYAVFAASGSFTLVRAILADTAAYAIAFGYLRGIHRILCLDRGEILPRRPDRREQRRLFVYGLYNNFNDAGTLLLDVKMDNFFIAALVNTVSVGIYAFYNRLEEMAENLSPLRLFDNVVQPLFFATRKEEAHVLIPRYFSLLLNVNFAVCWPILAYSLVYHAEIVQVIFGGKFIEYSRLLPFICAFAVLNSVAVPVTLVAQYEERAGLVLLSKLSTLFNVAGMVLLIPVAGLYGAVLARGVSVALKNGFIWWHVRRNAVWGNAATLLTMTAAIWGGAALACWLIKVTFGGAPATQLAEGVLISAAALLLYLRSPALSTSDRDLLAALFRGKEARTLAWLGIFRSSQRPGAAP